MKQRNLLKSTVLLLLLPLTLLATSNHDYQCSLSDGSVPSRQKSAEINIEANQIKKAALEDGKHSLEFNNYDGALFLSVLESGNQDPSLWISLDGRGLVLRLKTPQIQVYCHLNEF